MAPRGCTERDQSRVVLSVVARQLADPPPVRTCIRSRASAEFGLRQRRMTVGAHTRIMTYRSDDLPVLVLDGANFCDFEGFAREFSRLLCNHTWRGNLDA